MKIPSITVLTNGLIATLRRWPLSILLAIATSILLMRLFNDFSGEHERLWPYIMSGYEGMLLTIAVTILVERWGWGWVGKGTAQAIALGLMVLFYFWVPEQDFQRTLSFLVVTLALHWLIAFLPYLAPGDGPVGFWDYNRKLFLRGLQTVLYTLVLWAGIWLALEAIEHLFSVEFTHAYTNVWWTLAGIFNPIFFLAGFPRNYARPESKEGTVPRVYQRPAAIDDYPRGLKVFTQYVLLPIVTIYLAILYAYLFKIVFTAHWPSGWVAYLVLGFSVAGILALLLIWPLRDEEANRWVRSYSRFFYLALVPLIGLLWVAIWKRMGSYGVTEERYYVVSLAAWLTGIAVYFVFSKRKDIRSIPESLCVLALLSLWGPWSASSLSVTSQVNRLKRVLEKDGILVDGKIMAVRGPVSLKDRKQVSSIIEYIAKMHDYRVLQPLYRVNLDSAMKRDRDMTVGNYWERSRVLVSLIGFDYVNEYDMEDVALRKWYRAADTHPVIGTEDVRYIIPSVSVDGEWDYYSTGVSDSVGMRLDSGRHVLVIAMNGEKAGSEIDLRPLERAIVDSSLAVGADDLPVSVMTVKNEGWKVVVTNARTEGKPGSITHLEGYLLRLEEGGAAGAGAGKGTGNGARTGSGGGTGTGKK